MPRPSQHIFAPLWKPHQALSQHHSSSQRAAAPSPTRKSADCGHVHAIAQLQFLHVPCVAASQPFLCSYSEFVPTAHLSHVGPQSSLCVLLPGAALVLVLGCSLPHFSHRVTG